MALLQRFARANDFDAVTAAIAKVLVAERPAAMKLITKGLDYVRFAGLAVAVLAVERAPELVRLHNKITDAVTPFSVSDGSSAAFVGTYGVAATVD